MKPKQVAIGFFCFFFANASAWPQNIPAVDEDRSRQSLEAKIRKDIQEKLREKSTPKLEVTPPPVKKETPAPPVEILVQKFLLTPHPTIQAHEFESRVRAEDYRVFLATFEGRNVSLNELQELTAALEQQLRAKGYFAVIRIPPQELNQGTVTLEVLLSRMGELKVEGSRFFRASKTRSYWKIPEGQILEYPKILESIRLMNEIPDREVKPLLQAGKTPGRTDVILKTQERFPLHGSYSFDNQGVKLTGRHRQGFTLQYNNFLSLDDVFLIGTIFGHTYGAIFWQHLIPLNSAGTKFTWGVTHSQVNPKKEFEALGVNGISQNYQLGLRQQVFRSESFAAHLSAGFAWKEKSTRVLSQTSVWDRLRVLNTGGDFQTKDTTGIWTFRPEMSFGFSPHGDGYALTSRQAESNFMKWTYFLERQQVMPFSTKAFFKLEGQLSPDKLTPQEEMFLGGANSVRGYPEGDYGADQAVFASAEYRVPFFMIPLDWQLPHFKKPLRECLEMHSFFDLGRGRLRGPLATELRTRQLMSTGLGFSMPLSEKISAVCEWGFRLGDQPITENGDTQFHFRLQVGF